MPIQAEIKTPHILTQYQPELEQGWEAMIKGISADMRSRLLAGESAALFEDYALSPGKLIRPSLFLFGYTSWRPAIDPEIIELGLSLELLHLYLLIQDDVMDQSGERRGAPSLHISFAHDHRQRRLGGNSDIYGQNLAILFSDLCANWAEKCWSRAVAAGRIDPSVRHVFDELKETVYWGQYLDITLSCWPDIGSQDDLFAMMDQKTASYTLYYPLLLGAQLAGAPPAKLRWIKPFAHHLGIAFQIIDDILGTFGDSAVTGKPVNEDIKQKKQTILLFFAYAKGDAADRRLIRAYRKSRKVSAQLAEQIRQVLLKTDAASHSRALAEFYGQRALDRLSRSGLPAAQQAFLKELAEFVLVRAH